MAAKRAVRVCVHSTRGKPSVGRPVLRTKCSHLDVPMALPTQASDCYPAARLGRGGLDVPTTSQVSALQAPCSGERLLLTAGTTWLEDAATCYRVCAVWPRWSAQAVHSVPAPLPSFWQQSGCGDATHRRPVPVAAHGSIFMCGSCSSSWWSQLHSPLPPQRTPVICQGRSGSDKD